MLQYVADELKADRDIVLVRRQSSRTPWPLKYATDELKADEDIVLAVEQIVASVCCAADELKSDPEIRSLARANVPHAKSWRIMTVFK